MKNLTLTFLILSLVSLTACNTMEGFGEDLKYGGAALEQSAKSANKYSNKSDTNVNKDSNPNNKIK